MVVLILEYALKDIASRLKIVSVLFLLYLNSDMPNRPKIWEAGSNVVGIICPPWFEPKTTPATLNLLLQHNHKLLLDRIQTQDYNPI